MAVYRLLLRLYPKSFRDEYGREMLAIFAMRWREAGVFGRLALLIGAAVEVGVNALAVHIDLARQDLRHFLRTLRRAPGFAATAVLIMALGVVATTAVFSVADYVMLRPLPFPASHELVRIWETRPGYGQMELSPAALEGFASAKVLVEALRRAGPKPTRAKVLAALDGLKGYDVGGLEVSYSPQDHSGIDFADLSIISGDGRFIR